MSYVVRMPKLGMEMQEGELLEWHVAEGASVAEGDVVAVIESEKSTADVEAREDGVLRRQLIQPGTVVEPGTAMGVVAGPDDPIDDLLADVEGADATAPPATGDAGAEEGASDAAPAGAASESGAVTAADGDATAGGSTAADGEADAAATTTASDAGGSTAADGEAGDATATAAPGGAAAVERKVSPRARRRANETGVDLSGVEGTGPEGSIIEADVERAAEAGASSAGGAGPRATPKARRRARELDVPVDEVAGTGPDGAVTAADVESHAGEAGPAAAPDRDGAPAEEAPSAESVGAAVRTVREEREFSGMRRTIADRLSESYRSAVHVTVDRDLDVGELLHAADVADDGLDADVSMVDVFLLCLSETLADHPEFNATFEDGTHRLVAEHNVGMAVDVDDGLVTPVLPSVDGASLSTVATRRRAAVDAALSGEYTMDDLSGGTFTVSNLGVFGADSFTPVINPPEIAILGINRVREVPVWSGDDVTAGQRMAVSLSFDHRVVDGADAARFLGTLSEYVANPWSVLLDRR